MYKNITVEAENLELILENSHGDKVIIPANKRNWVKQKLSEGCHDCIDSLVETLPIASQYAGDGSVYPPKTKVKVNQNNQIKEYDISSPEYKTLYNSGKLMSYDKNTDTYIATPLKEVTITAEAPQWLKYKRKYESQYTKDWYIDNNMPKFSRSMGVSADNMHPNNVKEYDSYINDKVVEDIFKSKPTFDEDYSNDRLKTLQGFSQKELELIKNSKYASKIEPSIWSKFEQGLLSVGNMGSPVQFKNPSLSQEEAKKEDNPLNILQPLNIPSKMVQSAYKDNYSFTDALKGKQNNANIVEDIVTDPLNLVGLGIWSKLSKANKFSKLEDAYQAIKTLDKTTLEKQIGTTLSNDDWQYLYRVQEKGFDIEKPTLKAIEERVASGKGKWYDNNILNNPELRANMESRDRYYGQWFEKDPKRLDYYLADKEDIEILRTKVPKEILEQYRIDKFDPEIAKKWSLSHETEYILPKDLIQKAEKFKRNDWQKLIDEHEIIKNKVLNKTDDVVKQASKQLPSSNVVNISENQNFLTDLFKPKSKKTNSNFNFDKISERKFTTLDDFKTNYKSEYNVENPSRTFYGKKLNIEGEESNFLTRSIDDKIEKHYNNEITFQKFKDYGGDESSYQKLIDNINTPSKTVSSGVDVGLLTDEGVSLAVHNKYLDPAQTRSTLFHEKAHQSKVVASKREDSLLPKLWDDINELTGYTKNYTDVDKGSLGMYLDSPTEVYSRIMELKYKAGLKPYEKFTKELLEKTGEVVRDSNGKIIRMSGIMPPNYSKNVDKWLNLINKAPVIIPPVIGIGTAIQSQNQNKTEQ